MVVVAVALLALILLLATMQYVWLGQISDAERQRLRASLDTRAAEFAQDVDRELTRAYLLFQPDFTATSQDDAGERLAARYDRWQATARFPAVLKDFYVTTREDDGTTRLERLNVASRRLEPAVWPASMKDWSDALGSQADGHTARSGVFVRSLPPAVWESAPAIVVPMPLVIWSDRSGMSDIRFTPGLSYTILEIDRAYVTAEMLPALAKQHFTGKGDGFEYQLAVVSRTPDTEPIYRSTPAFAPVSDERVDAAVDLFQVRPQDFGAMAAEVRRFSTFVATVSPGTSSLPLPLPSGPSEIQTGRIRIERGAATAQGRFEVRSSPLSTIVVQQTGPSAPGSAAEVRTATTTRVSTASTPRWKLMVKHPSGSLESAVNAARLRNVILSTGILAVLGASVGLLILSTRRAQDLARRQMEFVATVSHELRTPLAVIRSAGDNLAEGVVLDEQQIRRYGDLVRNEGRRLTEMVEQILEFAGIQSGQRGFVLRPVGIPGLLGEVVDASSTLIHAASLEVEHNVPAQLPPALGDEAALRRVFQNLIGNAIKYGGDGGWIGLRAHAAGGEVHVTVEDRGIGIAAADQARIFEPFYRAPAVVAAQIQGAGLGLSLVKRIVEAHGGRLTVRSAPGQGSAFTVVLPAAADDPIATRDSLMSAPSHSQSAP